MKTSKIKIISLVSLLAVIMLSPSCKKEEDKQTPPDISFKTGTGYTSGDVTLTTNDTILVGINAAKTEDKDPLVRFVETQKYDAGAITTVLNESFTADTYSKDMTIITRSVTGTEVYTFTVINRDGITSTKSLTITVN